MELADYLEKEELTLRQFGALVGGAEESTVARWRDGIIFPSPDRLRRIEKATGSTVTYRDFQKTRSRRPERT